MSSSASRNADILLMSEEEEENIFSFTSNSVNNSTPGSEPLYNRVNHPSAHSRSRSWSHIVHQHQANTTSAMSALFSPIRVIQGIVPTLTNSVSNSVSNSQRLPSSPVRLIHENAAAGRNNISDHVRTRSEASRGHSRQSSAIEIDMNNIDDGSPPPSPEENNTNTGGNQMEFFGTITWVEKAIPFVILLLSRIMWDHRLGILVFIGLFGTFFHVNSTIKKQVGLKERRLNRIAFGIFIFLFANIIFIYYAFKNQQLENCLLLGKPMFYHSEVWTVFWCVGITDFVVRFVTMALKCVIIILPRRLVNFRKRGKYFLLMENASQFYRMIIPVPQWYVYFSNYGLGGEYFALLSTCVYFGLKCRMLFIKAKEVRAALVCFWKDTRYGCSPSKDLLLEGGNSCPICQEDMVEPIELNLCKHIFCEDCIVMWFDRERTCPMCRAKVAEDPQWRDGSTQAFIQLF